MSVSPFELGFALFLAATGVWGCVADNAKLPTRYRWMCALALFLGGATVKHFLLEHAIK